MATIGDWIEGARPRTLPAAAAPVLVGTAAAVHMGAREPLNAALALLVALALQIGVNYSNDYSDGIRGTDEHRTGPARLTGGGLARPRTVLGAALACFLVAGVAGLALLALSGAWLLIVPGIAAVIAAWFYTGGRTPYGYMGIGLSELFVFVFFGLMACVGTTWTQTPQAPWWLWLLASALGLLSVALLMVNNIRDIPTDLASGKRTLAVRMGQRPSRIVFSLCFVAAALAIATVVPHIGYSTGVGVGVGASTLAVSIPLASPVIMGATGKDLIPALRNTGLFTLGWALVVSAFLIAG